MKTVNRVINYSGVLIFAIFAWLQREDDNPEIYTDPSVVDVWLWIGFYSLVSMSFLLANFNKFPKWLYLLIIMLGIYFIAFTVKGFIINLSNEEFNITKEAMNPQQPHIETTREFFGAIIALIAVGYLYLCSCKNLTEHSDFDR